MAVRNCKVDVGDTRVGGGGHASNWSGRPARQVSQCAPCSVLPNEPKNSSNQPHAFLLYSSEESNS